MKLKQLRMNLHQFISGILNRKLHLYAASGTYFIFMSIVPVTMLGVSLVQYLPISQEYIIGELHGLLPQQVTEVLEHIIRDLYENGRTAMTVSIILTVFSASTAMRAVMRGLDAAYSGKKQPFLIYYMRSILYMILFVAALIVSFVIMAFGGKIMSLIQGLFPDVPWLRGLFEVLRYLRYVVVMLFLFVAFLFMYRFIPVHKVRLADQLPGALLVSVGWGLFSMVFSAYLSYSDRFGAYGVIGSVMAAMMWLYYSILFVLVGGWMNSFLTRRREETGSH